jgi:hypothetical protein
MMAKAKTTTTAKFENPYKEGSGKRVIYDVFMTAGGGKEGLAAAMKAAKENEVKEGTIKSWSSMWLRGMTKPGTSVKPKADKPKGDNVSLKNGEFHPLFKHTTREKADKEHEALCERNGIRPHAFHVIEDKGRFAVVPANYKPGGPVPTFKVGDIVYDALIANSKAKVIEAGPEQSMVRYAEERPNRPREECVINRFLVKLPDAPAKKSKRDIAAEMEIAKAGKPSKVTTKTRQRL